MFIRAEKEKKNGGGFAYRHDNSYSRFCLSVGRCRAWGVPYMCVCVCVCDTGMRGELSYRKISNTGEGSLCGRIAAAVQVQHCRRRNGGKRERGEERKKR